MYKLPLSFLCMLSLTSHTMDLWLNVTQSGECPPCECSDHISSLVALSITAGGLITCYTINRCLARRKTPVQIRQEEINNLRRQLEEAQGREILQRLKAEHIQANLKELITSSHDDSIQESPTEPLLPARQRIPTSINLSDQSITDSP